MTAVISTLRSRTLLLALAALVLTWSSSQGERLSAQTTFARLEATAREELQQQQTPGAAIAIVHDGRLIYSRGFGVANVETGEETRPEMLFRLGSTTKMFTAATVVLLAEQGKIRLTDPIGNYIAGLTPKLAALTAHQLLSHTSGILDEAPMFGSHDDDALKREIASWTDTRFFAEPGQIYSYSNPGYWLAGRLAEQVGGKPFADQVASSIFAPLGMSRSTFRPTLAMTYPLSQGHDLIDGKPQIIRPSANNSASWPAGSIFSNVIDLSRWISAFVDAGVLNGQQVLPAAVFATLATPKTPIPGTPNKYGYGVQVGDWRGLQVVGHGGSRSGYGSTIRMVPSRRFGVVVLANRTGVGMTRTADAALEAVLNPVPQPTPAKLTTMVTSAADRVRFVGKYSQGPRQMTVAAKGDELFVTQSDREVLLRRIGELEFTAGENRFVFVTDTAGVVTFLHSGGRSWRKMQIQ
jgi:CubicO group peptidase (beta-lactamase class C family)